MAYKTFIKRGMLYTNINDIHALKRKILISTLVLPEEIYEDKTITYKDETSETKIKTRRVKGLRSILEKSYGYIPENIPVEISLKYPRGNGNHKGTLETIKEAGEIYLSTPIQIKEGNLTKTIHYLLRTFQYSFIRENSQLMMEANSLKIELQRLSGSKQGLEKLFLEKY